MKSPLIQIKNLHISFLAAETPSVATTLEPFAVKRSSAVDSATSVPALGEFWPGQGGHNGGLVAAHGNVAAHYLIIAAKDVGSHEWGERGSESQATSKRDGFANTVTLMEGDHPAAKAATGYTADGHDNFYLPAAAELYHCWLNAPDLFAKDTWYWSSTQRSAHLAFYMYFDGGFQLNFGKNDGLRVRPVRRLFI
ncbi:Lcl C-terminal domain-containing protein [Pseudomonas helleri]|uniref:DUF1566 domain-containing protein n=1 Tax=Pseudomonas helleri TaxID=1608996 RepID=UPI0012951C5D|nr:DUF1566 domain-containing protein [Pseudomonas helleri]